MGTIQLKKNVKMKTIETNSLSNGKHKKFIERYSHTATKNYSVKLPQYDYLLLIIDRILKNLDISY